MIWRWDQCTLFLLYNKSEPNYNDNEIFLYVKFQDLRSDLGVTYKPYVITKSSRMDWYFKDRRVLISGNLHIE